MKKREVRVEFRTPPTGSGASMKRVIRDPVFDWREAVSLTSPRKLSAGTPCVTHIASPTSTESRTIIHTTRPTVRPSRRESTKRTTT